MIDEFYLKCGCHYKQRDKDEVELIETCRNHSDEIGDVYYLGSNVK